METAEGSGPGRPARPAVVARHAAAAAARRGRRARRPRRRCARATSSSTTRTSRSATSVEALVEQAVDDPDVLAIKLTVYRTSDDSPLVPALIRAAERGKQAVCLVELKARFDERANIEWARSWRPRACTSSTASPALKTHAKCLLIVRRERDGVRHYVHVGTGNYHATTARLYTDFGLLTCDEQIGADVADMFNFLTGFARAAALPHGADRAGAPARRHPRRDRRARWRRTRRASPRGSRMKMNSLVDTTCIQALYRASQAGVPIELNIRGICCLRPGVPGVSENDPRRLGRRALPRALADLRVRARRRDSTSTSARPT